MGVNCCVIRISQNRADTAKTPMYVCICEFKYRGKGGLQ